VSWLKAECGVDQSGAEQAAEYVAAGRAILGAIPTQTTVIAERFFDESGGMQLIIHAPFGARINKAWGTGLRKRFCRSFNFELQAAATDNGLNISLSEQHSFPLGDVFHFLHPNSCSMFSSKQRCRLRYLRPAGVGMPGALSLFCVFAAEKSSPNIRACAPMICSRRFFPRRSPARKISKAKSFSPITH